MQKKIDEIYAADLTDLEKITQAFNEITSTIMTQGSHQIELLRAAGDQESVIKEQIKTSTVKLVRDVYATCHVRVVGTWPWEKEG